MDEAAMFKFVEFACTSLCICGFPYLFLMALYWLFFFKFVEAWHGQPPVEPFNGMPAEWMPYDYFDKAQPFSCSPSPSLWPLSGRQGFLVYMLESPAPSQRARRPILPWTGHNDLVG